MSSAIAPMAVQKRASRLRRSKMLPATSASRSGTPRYEPFSIGESKTMCHCESRSATSESPNGAWPRVKCWSMRRHDETDRIDRNGRDGRGRLGRAGDVMGPGHGEPCAVADAQRDDDDRAPGEGRQPPPVERHVLPQHHAGAEDRGDAGHDGERGEGLGRNVELRPRSRGRPQRRTRRGRSRPIGGTGRRRGSPDGGTAWNNRKMWPFAVAAVNGEKP